MGNLQILIHKKEESDKNSGAMGQNLEISGKKIGNDKLKIYCLEEGQHFIENEVLFEEQCEIDGIDWKAGLESSKYLIKGYK